MLKLPTGFRYLDVGEIIEPTDLINANQDGLWVPINSIRTDSIGGPVMPLHYEICRLAITPKGNQICLSL